MFSISGLQRYFVILWWSVWVLFVDKLLAEEGLFAHAHPELAVHVAFWFSVQVLEQALWALFHTLLQIFGALSLFGRIVACDHQTKLVHEKGWGGDFDGFRVTNYLSDDASRSSLIWVPNHLLKAFLDEACKVDDSAISWSFNFIVLEEDISAVELDGFINNVMASRVHIVVWVLRSHGQNRNSTCKLSLFAVEFRVIAHEYRFLNTYRYVKSLSYYLRPYFYFLINFNVII